MSIKYEPDKLLKKIAPASKIKKLVKDGFKLKKTALNFVSGFDILDKDSIVDTALKVIKGYKKRIKEDPDIKDELKADPKQLVQRVQNEVVLQIADGIKKNYDGERFIWLPSDADEPRPEHQLNYGMEFSIGDGEMPGDEYGCRCGMQILVDGDQLEL